jgi:hypothetical protein
MKAQIVADKLAKRGCTYTRVVEPNQDTPGKVQIRKHIHVEVPLEGDVLYVVMKHSDSEIQYGRPRKRIGYIELDISCAIYQGHLNP